MGETTDQLRRQVDRKRDDASQKIDQIEQKVMGKAQSLEEQVTEKADEVKAQLNWRYQVEEHPLLSVGVAMVGGMVLGSVLDKGDHHENREVHVPQQGMHHQGGIGESIRKAARRSGLDDSIQNFTSAAMGMLGERMRESTDRMFPGMLDKVQHAADRVAEAAGGENNERTSFADAGPGMSTYAT